ncbi:hypothetical protein OUZ56_011708 [Daphnia magna]|uniref:Uncharacterized protein n=1 Tax=Daphnia magna TaxID=35525 RepID=A0ABQ9Z101_9CRUS|nr:hypothetical protein OUZ56_011708 [Daphnia magna]
MNPQKRPPLSVNTLSARRRTLCPPKRPLYLPVDPIVVFARSPLIVCARQPNPVSARRLIHSLCPSTQSLPAKISVVFARQITHSLCPSSHSLPTKMRNEVARQLIYCLWLSNP